VQVVARSRALERWLWLPETGTQRMTRAPPWPDNRPHVRIGQLKIVRTTTVEEIGDPVMLHDPTRLTDGIEPSDDPVLAARRGVYELSVLAEALAHLTTVGQQ
jgi:hypothetical protein